MYIYKVYFESKLNKLDPDVDQAVESLNRIVCEDCSDLYHSQAVEDNIDANEALKLMNNAEKLLSDYVLKRYIRFFIEPIELEEDED